MACAVFRYLAPFFYLAWLAFGIAWRSLEPLEGLAPRA